jgi:hypothetical protein
MRLPVALFALVACLQAFTQTSRAETRVALVIGNGAYLNVPRLPNPSNDAADVAAALRRSGFDAILAVNLDRAAMDEATIKFAKAARTADVAMFYYSGHALQFGGVNYLAPVDADLQDEADLRRMTRVDEIVSDLRQAKNLRILVLDSCRDNPLADQLKRSIGSTRAMPLQRGLAKIDSPQGMIVAYATQAGRTAEDGSGRNSPYTSSFLSHIEEQEEIGAIFRRISSDVYEKTKHEQLPELSLSLIGEFYFRGHLELNVPVTPSIDPCGGAAETHWKSAEAIGTIGAFEDHLARFGNCYYAGLAKARIDELKNKKDGIAPSAQFPPAPAPQALVTPPSPPRSSGRSPRSEGWLTAAEYQNEFDAMVRKHRYPPNPEAQIFDGTVLYRATFVPFPRDHFYFWTHTGLSEEQFDQKDRLYRAQGCKLVHRQSVNFEGMEIIQATWVRQ